ncbi:hypothetical protein [Haladaptatus pallidirubidus]|uniref:hypothetical protein n=1 Tax=Haladaptatus pallidirubidus TaxID=1008152 RepID=UPI0036F35D1D
MQHPRGRPFHDLRTNRVESSDKIASDDRDIVLTFSDRLNLLAQQYTDYRHEKLLRHCTIIAEQLDGGRLPIVGVKPPG